PRRRQRDREADQGEARGRRPGRRRGRAAARPGRLLSMADGRVARLDGIDVGDAEVVRAPVARLDELPAAEPGRERSGPAPAGPVDLGRVGDAAPAAPVADLAAPGGAQRDSTAGAAGPVALFDVPSVSAGRDDVTVVELGPAALDGRAIRG